MRAGGAGNAMDDIIWLVIQPLAFIDDVVCHLGTRQQSKSAYNVSSLIQHDMATTQFNVFPKHIIAGITIRPLESIAVTTHDLASLVAQIKDGR